MTRSESDSKADRSALPSCGGDSHSRSSSSSIHEWATKVQKIRLADGASEFHEHESRSHQKRRHATPQPQPQPQPQSFRPRNRSGDPLHTPPYIYTPCTPPDIDTTSHSHSNPSPYDHDFLTTADRDWSLDMCEDEFELRVRELHAAAKSLAAARAVEQACLLRAQKMHKRRQRCLRRALELADACFLSEEESEVGVEGTGKPTTSSTREERTQRRRNARWTIQQARATYERNWETIASQSNSCLLSFSSIPWPVLTRPSGPSSITRAEMCAFIFGDLKPSASATAADQAKRKERVKSALRRWHPDKFARYVERVEEGEREVVLEAAGNIARCLNELL